MALHMGAVAGCGLGGMRTFIYLGGVPALTPIIRPIDSVPGVVG